MTYGVDQRLELLERGLCEVASILAGMAKDRATDDEDDLPPDDDLRGRARPA